jgi:hypothetical protein
MNQDLLSRTPSDNSLNTWCWMELASSLEMTGPPYYSLIWIWNFDRFDRSMRQWGANSCTTRHPNISCTLPLPRSALVLCNPSGRWLVLARPLEMSNFSRRGMEKSDLLSITRWTIHSVAPGSADLDAIEGKSFILNQGIVGKEKASSRCWAVHK